MPKCRDNKTKRRPQEDEQDQNKEEWKRKDYNYVHKCKLTSAAMMKISDGLNFDYVIQLLFEQLTSKIVAAPSVMASGQE